MPSSPHIVAVIPARYGSTRFPGKMLADLGGAPLIVRTLQNVLRCHMPHEVLVATEHDRIATAIREAGAEALMTDPELPSGSDRIHAALAGRPGNIVVNVQGDEPMLPPQLIDDTIQLLLDTPGADVTTAATPLINDQLANPNVVKIALAQSGQALYFSRAPIPFQRDKQSNELAGFESIFWRHIGLYVYRREVLNEFCSQRPSPLERTEKLEQLRLLENGKKIFVHRTEDAGPGGVDTRDDLERINRVFEV